MTFEEEVLLVGTDLVKAIGNSSAQSVLLVFMRDSVCPVCPRYSNCQRKLGWIEEHMKAVLPEAGKDLLDYLKEHKIPVPEGGWLAGKMLERFHEPPITCSRIYDLEDVVSMEAFAFSLTSSLIKRVGLSEEIVKLVPRFVSKCLCPHCEANRGQECPSYMIFIEVAGPEEGPDIMDIMIRLGKLEPDSKCDCLLCEILSQKIARGEGKRPEDEVLRSLGIDTSVNQVIRLAVVSGGLSAKMRGVPEA